MKPNKLMKLIVTGQGPCGINHNAPKNVIGMPTMTQPATFMRRNSDRIRPTRSAPWINVLRHHVEAALQVPGAIDPRFHRHARRQGGRLFLDVFLYGRRGRQLVLGATGEHAHDRRRLTVEAPVSVGFDETVLDRRDVANRQARAIRIGAQHKIGELRSGIGLSLGA